MELAMHCRDSGSWISVRLFDRSEWTVGIRHRLPAVAFPGCVRQQLFELGDEPRVKVTCPRGECYRTWCASSGRTEESRHMLSFGLASLVPVSCRPWRTACSALEL